MGSCRERRNWRCQKWRRRRCIVVRTISGRCPGISALSYRQHKRPISPWHWKPSETTTQQLSIAPEAQRKPLSLAIPQPHHSASSPSRSIGRYHCPRGLGDPPFIHRIRNFNLDMSPSMEMNIQLSTIHQKRRHLSSHLFHLSSRTTTTRARARDFGTVGTHFVARTVVSMRSRVHAAYYCRVSVQ